MEGQNSRVSPGRTFNQGVFDSYRKRVDRSLIGNKIPLSYVIGRLLTLGCQPCCSVRLSRCGSGLSCASTRAAPAPVALYLNSSLKGQFDIYLSNHPDLCYQSIFIESAFGGYFVRQIQKDDWVARVLFSPPWSSVLLHGGGFEQSC